MSERFQLPTAMWAVQYALLGGHRRTMMFVFGYAGLLTVGVFIVRRMFLATPFPTVAAWCLNALAGIQVVIAMLGGCNAIHRAILRDFENKMIESHRITPMSGTGVCLGYMFGSALQVMVSFSITLVVAVGLTLAAGLPLLPLLQGNLLILSGALSLWSAVVFAGMRLKKPISPAPILIGVSVFSVPIMMGLPGAGLLLGLYPTIFGFSVATGTMPIPDLALIVVVLVNVVFAFLWLGAAAVKYRRPDLPALSGRRGLVFLFLWLVVATGGVLAYEYITRTSMRGQYDRSTALTQWVATIIASLVVATVVTLCTTQCHWLIHQGRSARSAWDRISPVPFRLAAMVLVLAVMGGLGFGIWKDLIPGYKVDPDEWPRALARIWCVTALALLLTMITAHGVFLSALTVLRVKSAWATTLGLLLAIWALPPILDVVLSNVIASRDTFASTAYTWLFACSAPGAIGAAWTVLDIKLFPGLAVQGALAVLVTLLARRGRTAT